MSHLNENQMIAACTKNEKIAIKKFSVNVTQNQLPAKHKIKRRRFFFCWVREKKILWNFMIKLWMTSRVKKKSNLHEI